MELLIYLILFLFVLIISTTTNKLLPFLPLPLVQILLGIGIGLFVPDADFHLNTELFLAMVIGPLLFREAEEADITSILKHWRIVVFLIFPVIFISTLSLGGMAHFLWMTLPLAACLAVGAALGPTAVSYTHLDVYKRQDKDNQDGKRPSSVTVKLLADGQDTGKTLELNAANGWTGSFTGLDADKGLSLIHI